MAIFVHILQENYFLLFAISRFGKPLFKHARTYADLYKPLQNVINQNSVSVAFNMLKSNEMIPFQYLM